MCQKLDPFFEAKGESFIDPDEVRDVDESELSEFIYDLPEGFDSDEAKEANVEYLDENAMEEKEMRGLVDESGLATLLSSVAVTPKTSVNLGLETG